MSSAQPDGIGYAEQEEAVRALSRHYTDGRLDVDEFDERVRRARSSTTGTELGAVFADLPRPHPSGSTASEDAASARPEPGPWEFGASSEQTVSTPRKPGGAGPQPAAGDGYGFDETARSPAAAPRYPDTAQYPGHRYADQPYPGHRYPDQPYPGHRYPDQPYPGMQDPGVQYPGGQYPGAQYPGSPYPGGYQYGAPQYGAPQYAGEYPPPGVPYGFAPGGYDPAAPYGRDPLSGRPYSDKQKIVAGLLQVFLPFGVGRFYTGDVGIGVAQLLVTFVTFGFGAIWSFIDGIVYLAGSPTDRHGRPLRP